MGSQAETGGRRPGERASSSFSTTCRRLSQYLKEKGSFGDLGLGLGMAPAGPHRLQGEPGMLLRTLNLLPGAGDGQGADGDAVPEHPKVDLLQSVELFPRRPGFGAVSDTIPDLNRELRAATMTIFYGGKVVVFDNFPADKAGEMMEMAGRGCPPPAQSSPSPPHHHSSPPTAGAATASETTGPVAGAATASAADAAAVEQDASQKPPPPGTSDMPIARRVSLHRFLEKRKDRITAKAPYPVSSSSGANGSSSASPAKGEDDGRQWLGLAPQASKPEDSGAGLRRPEKMANPGGDHR